jgi:hypothetical protein
VKYDEEGFTKIEPPPKEPEVGNDQRTRLAGAVMLLAGTLLAYVSVYEPLQAAARQEEKVQLFMKGAFVCPFAVIMGFIMLLLGKQTNEVFGPQPRRSPMAWFVGISLFLMGAGLYFLVRTAIKDQGYQF